MVEDRQLHSQGWMVADDDATCNDMQMLLLPTEDGSCESQQDEERVGCLDRMEANLHGRAHAATIRY